MPFGEARGLMCPVCGIGQCRAARTGRANEQSIFLRRRYCDNPDCGFAGNTFETWFEGAHIDQMDEDIKFARMMRDRKARGYKGFDTGHPKPPTHFGSIRYTIVNDSEWPRVITNSIQGIWRRITSTIHGNRMNEPILPLNHYRRIDR